MAQVDASIPLRAIGGQGGMTTAEAFSLADFAEERQQRREERPYRMEALRAQSQKNSLSLQEMQLNLKKAQGVLKIAQTPGMMDEDGAPTAEGVKAGMAIDPEIGQAWGKQRREASKAKMEETYQKMDMLVKQGQLDEKSAKNVKETFTELSKVYTSKLNKAIAYHDQNPHETAVAAVQAEAERRHKAGLLNDDQYQKIIGAKWDNEMAEGIISAGEPTKTPSEYEDIIKRQKGLSTTSPEWKQLEERRKHLTEFAPTVTIMQTAEGKPVAVQTQANKPPTVTDIPAGKLTKPSTDKEGGEGGRAQVFTNRMITSANEAMRGLENVVKLPATTTRGILGGRQQDGGLLAATKETLANKVTGEEAQLYNVMTAGIQRNLASIEAVGLMPSGALTHMMDNVIIKEGDTQLTKAAKLAEIRQILEAGMEPILSNPKVPEQLKSLVKDIQARVTKAVPFTQDDVISLMGSPDPDKTLGSIVKGQRKDSESGAIIKPYNDAAKEKRYQEYLRKHPDAGR
jgi:hypothetical protein